MSEQSLGKKPRLIDRIGCLLGLLLVVVLVCWLVFIFGSLRGRHVCGEIEGEIVEAGAFSGDRGGQISQQIALGDDGNRYVIHRRHGELAVGDRVRIVQACRADGEVLLGPARVDRISE